MRLVLPRSLLLDKATIDQHLFYCIQRIEHDDIQNRESRNEFVRELLVWPDIGVYELQRDPVLLEVFKMVQVLPAYGVYVGVAPKPLAEVIDAVFPLEIVVSRYF